MHDITGQYSYRQELEHLTIGSLVHSHSGKDGVGRMLG